MKRPIKSRRGSPVGPTEVSLDELPRQPRYNGNYANDTEELMQMLSPQTRQAANGAWALGGRALSTGTIRKVAEAADANIDSVLMWCGYVHVGRGRYVRFEEACLALIDRYNSESIAIFRLFRRHWPNFQTDVRLTGAVV